MADVVDRLRLRALQWRDAAEDEAGTYGEGTEDQEGMEANAAELDEAAREIESLRARLSQAGAGGVVVKPIDWRDMTYQGVEEWIGHCALSQSFTIKDEGEDRLPYRFTVRPFLSGVTSFSTVTEAKAAAQADYEARILSAILPPEEAQAGSPAEALPSQTSGAEAPETKGPYEPRICKGMPTDCCDYGVVSLSAGREVCRVWREQDARAIAAALTKPASEPAGGGVEKLLRRIHFILSVRKGDPTALGSDVWEDSAGWPQSRPFTDVLCDEIDAALSSTASSSPAALADAPSNGSAPAGEERT